MQGDTIHADQGCPTGGPRTGCSP